MAAAATTTNPLTVAKLKARGLLRDIIEEAISEEVDWPTAKERLRAKICNANKHTRISSFMEIKQGKDSLPAYVHRFRKDMKKASFTDTTAAIGIFLKGLTKATILAPKVYEENPTTLDEAITIVENAQAAVDATTAIIKEEPQRVTQITSQETYNRAPTAIVSYRDYPNLPCSCNPERPHVRLCQNACCKNCNFYGHWGQDCLNSQQNKNNHGRNHDRYPPRSRSRGYDRYRSHSREYNRDRNNYRNHHDSRNRNDRRSNSRSQDRFRSQSRDRYSRNSYDSRDRRSRDTNRYSRDKQRDSSNYRNRSNSRNNQPDSRSNRTNRYNDRSKSPNRGRHGSSHNRSDTPGVTFSREEVHSSDSEDNHLN